MVVDVLQGIDIAGFVVEHIAEGENSSLCSVLLGFANIAALTLNGLVIIVAFMAINRVRQNDFKILCVLQVPFIILYGTHVGSLSGNLDAQTYQGYMMAVYIIYSFVCFF